MMTLTLYEALGAAANPFEELRRSLHQTLRRCVHERFGTTPNIADKIGGAAQGPDGADETQYLNVISAVGRVKSRHGNAQSG